MRLRVATFNVEGLAHQWDPAARADPISLHPSRSGGDIAGLAKRIADLDADVVCLQHLESAAALQRFLQESPERSRSLSNLYPYFTGVEGNDARGLALGVLSRLPLGAITTWKHISSLSHPSVGLARDLLEIEVLTPDARSTLLTIFNTHCVDPLCDADSSSSRAAESEVIKDVLVRRAARRRYWLLLGTLGCDPSCADLACWSQSQSLDLTNALAQAVESRPFVGSPPPEIQNWTVRREREAQVVYEASDQIWTSRALVRRILGAVIDRRESERAVPTHHDPAWIFLDLSGISAPRTGELGQTTQGTARVRKPLRRVSRGLGSAT